MVFSIETIQPKVPQSLPTINDTNPEEEEQLERIEVTEPSNENTEQKQSRLEMTLSKIKQQLDYSMNVTESVSEKLKRDFKDNQKGAVKFILDCFDEMLNDDGFIAWLAKSINYKPCRLKQILNENKPNNRNSKFTSANFQEMHDFWLDNCINSNESAYNIKRITKRSFLEQYSNIKDSNIIEKIVQLKKVRRKFCSWFPGWYTLNWSVNCIQSSAKSILKSQRHFSSSTNRTIALDQLKKKSPVVCASIALIPIFSFNRSTSTANQNIYHHTIL